MLPAKPLGSDSDGERSTLKVEGARQSSSCPLGMNIWLLLTGIPKERTWLWNIQWWTPPFQETAGKPQYSLFFPTPGLQFVMWVVVIFISKKTLQSPKNASKWVSVSLGRKWGISSPNSRLSEWYGSRKHTQCIKEDRACVTPQVESSLNALLAKDWKGKGNALLLQVQ